MTDLALAWKNRIIEHDIWEASRFMANPKNWRLHPKNQAAALTASLEQIGWIDEVKVNINTGFVLDGHLRVTLALSIGPRTPVPVMLLELSEEEEDLALATFDPITAMAEADKEKVAALLETLHTEDARLNALLQKIREEEGLISIDRPEHAQPNPRKLPLDFIYTIQGCDATCCLAVRSGLLYGIQSPHSRICAYWLHYKDAVHKPQFVDNEYTEYDHAAHVMMVKEHRPKYCTVRDVMTEEQCLNAGIDFYPLEQILDFAEELSAYAENVILIPKFDCLARIPEKFMVGYSVPTSHGSTPLPVDAFKGRRVHLLGGSWKEQLAYMAALGDDVKSVDNNYIQLQANFGSFVYPDGRTGTLSESLGLSILTNPRYTCMAISFGSVGSKLRELYGNSSKE